MSNGLYSDMFLEAEIVYRRERAMAHQRRRAARQQRPRFSRHFHRKASQRRQDQQPVVG